MKKRFIRNYDIPFDLHEWLEEKAKIEGRAVIRQVEKIIRDAKNADEVKNAKAK